MSIKKIINNETLKDELKHNINNTKIIDNKPEKIRIQKYINFDISSIDTILYKNHLTLIVVYFIICSINTLRGDIFSLLNPILMFLLIVFLSSNTFKIKNNRFLDVGIWNLINSFNMLLKSLQLIKLNNSYKKIVKYFTMFFINSLLLSGFPAFNTIFVLISLGLWVSYLLCFINKDIDSIKKSCEQIQKNEILYTLISVIFFNFIFKINAINATVFTHLAILTFFNNSIESLQINEINTTTNQKDF